jgi:hypothetical protein
MSGAEVAEPSFVSKAIQTAIDLGKTVFVGAYSVVTAPPPQVYGLLALTIAIVCLLIIMNRRWV